MKSSHCPVLSNNLSFEGRRQGETKQVQLRKEKEEREKKLKKVNQKDAKYQRIVQQ